MEDLCDRVLYLDSGRVAGIGEPREMLARYRLDVSAREGTRLADEHVADQEVLRAAPAEPAQLPAERGGGTGEPGGRVPPEHDAAVSAPAEPPKAAPPRRWGDRSAVITSVKLLDAAGTERYTYRTGESVTIEIASSPNRPLSDFVFGIGLFTPEDVCVHGSNTEIDRFEPGLFDAPAVVRVTLPRCDLGAGTYLLDVAIHDRRGTPYDYWRGACRFRIDSPDQDAGLYRPERIWSAEGGIRWKRV